MLKNTKILSGTRLPFLTGMATVCRVGRTGVATHYFCGSDRQKAGQTVDRDHIIKNILANGDTWMNFCHSPEPHRHKRIKNNFLGRKPFPGVLINEE
ncbi:hypothetical protein DN748_07755 [Sinomicrobium soli]|nr:hypothetical protein DN748_07755 [Sinomicrobium sp. N-1-3-6]